MAAPSITQSTNLAILPGRPGDTALIGFNDSPTGDRRTLPPALQARSGHAMEHGQHGGIYHSPGSQRGGVAAG